MVSDGNASKSQTTVQNVRDRQPNLSGVTVITQVKNNQKTLLEEVKQLCLLHQPIGTQQDEIDKAHERIERRQYLLFEAKHLPKWLKDVWPYIRRIVKVIRYREVKGHKPSIEVSYYITNDKNDIKVKELSVYIRNHWFIENMLHYVKDVSFRGDTTVKRRRPHVFSTFIDFALNIMRNKGERNIRTGPPHEKNCLNILQKKTKDGIGLSVVVFFLKDWHGQKRYIWGVF
ncbi:MAG: ISAs1 family transposase [Holosporaceae bacterium]|nr:ISAs1 family transposase [Holosporaceae bacterium]